MIFLRYILLWGICCTGLQAKNLAYHDDAPKFTLTSLSGEQQVSLAQLQGKVVYLDFWASWCAPCRKSFPYLNQLHRKYASQGFTVLAVNLDDNTSDANAFLSKFPVSYPIVKGEASVMDSYGVTGLPVAYIINKRGQVETRLLGFTPRHLEYIEAVVEKALSEFDATTEGQ